MFVRLTLADVNEGEMNNALEYVKNTVIPSYDGIAGLLGIAACATNDGKFMAWSTWANEEAKNASIDKFNQALAGAAEMLDGQPEVGFLLPSPTRSILQSVQPNRCADGHNLGRSD